MTTSISMLAALAANQGVSRAKFRAFSAGNSRTVDLIPAISKLLGGRAAVVPGTLKVSTSGRNYSDITCVLRAVRPVRAVELDETGRTEGFTMLSKNLYMDEKDKASWSLRKDGDRTTLVRQGDLESDEALNAIMTAMTSTSSARVQHTNDLVDSVHELASSVNMGVLVSYLQADTKAHKIGFSLSAVQDDYVEVVPVVGNLERVHCSQLIHAFDAAEYVGGTASMPKPISTSAERKTTKKDLIDYYRQVFGYNDDFWTKFEAMILRSGV